MIISLVTFALKASADLPAMASQSLLCMAKQTIGLKAVDAKKSKNIGYRDLVNLSEMHTKAKAILSPLTTPLEMTYYPGFFWSHNFKLESSQIHREASGFCFTYGQKPRVGIDCIINKKYGKAIYGDKFLLSKKNYTKSEQRLFGSLMEKLITHPDLRINNNEFIIINTPNQIRNHCTGICANSSSAFIERGVCEVSK